MSKERTLPHTIEGERSVLGATLIEEKAMKAARLLLSPGSFYREGHRLIFSAEIRLADRGAPIDLVTLKDELERSGDLDNAGGPAYLASLIDGVPRSDNIEFYARMVQEKERDRAAIIAADAFKWALFDRNGAGPGEGREGIDAAIADLRPLLEPARSGAAGLFEEIDVATALREGVQPIRFDLPPYLAAGTLTLISGPPKSAKTWIALDWSICLATGHKFCGLEPQGEQRVLFLEAEYPRQIIIRCGELCRAMQINPEEALERIKFIRPRRRLQLEDPAQAAALVAAAQDFKATVVVIDSLRRVHGLDENNSRDMATLADGALLPLRGNEERTVLVIDHDAKAWQMGSRPKSQRLRGSGDKMASCDVLLHVEKHEPEGEPRRYELTVAASRVADEDIDSLWLQIHATTNGGVLVDIGEPVEGQKRGGRGRKPTQHDIAVNVIRAQLGVNPKLTWKEAIEYVMKEGPSRRTALNAWNECKGQSVQEVQE